MTPSCYVRTRRPVGFQVDPCCASKCKDVCCFMLLSLVWFGVAVAVVVAVVVAVAVIVGVAMRIVCIDTYIHTYLYTYIRIYKKSEGRRGVVRISPRLCSIGFVK